MCFMLITRGIPVLQVINGELQSFIPEGALTEGLYKTRAKAEEAGKLKTKHGGSFEIIEWDKVLNLGD